MAFDRNHIENALITVLCMTIVELLILNNSSVFLIDFK